MSQKSQPYGCQYGSRVDKAVREVEAQKDEVSYARISHLTIDSAAMLPRLPKPYFVLLSAGPGGPVEMLQQFLLLQPHLSPGFRLWQNFQCGWSGDTRWEFHIGRCYSGKCATGQRGPLFIL